MFLVSFFKYYFYMLGFNISALFTGLMLQHAKHLNRCSVKHCVDKGSSQESSTCSLLLFFLHLRFRHENLSLA